MLSLSMTGESAQQTWVLATKPEDSGSIPVNHMVKEPTSCSLTSTRAQVHTHTHTHKSL